MSVYLDALDAILNIGLGRLGSAIPDRAAAFVLQQQAPDGGFPGRSGQSDLYYTDFALRVLALASWRPEPVIMAVRWAERAQGGLHTIVDCFSLLNIRRIAKGMDVEVKLDMEPVEQILLRSSLPSGGFPRNGGDVTSAYNTFLAALCFEMLEIPYPSPAATVDSLARLARDSGGFSETDSGTDAQTNATTASMAALTMLSPDSGSIDPSAVSRFLSAMQRPDGGVAAQAIAPDSDLLSTFTAVVCMFGLGRLADLDLPRIARFTAALSTPDGGFRSCPRDPEADIEYTYYGLGVLALLQAYVVATE